MAALEGLPEAAEINFFLFRFFLTFLCLVKFGHLKEKWDTAAI